MRNIFWALGLFCFVVLSNKSNAQTTASCDCRKITIATEGTKFEPFKKFDPVFKNQDGLNMEIGKAASGFEIELLQVIFKQMKSYEPTFIFNYDTVGEVSFEATLGEVTKKSKGPIDFAALFPGLSQKRKDSDNYVWDMTIATTGITQERRDKFQIEFSKSYFTPIKHFFATEPIVNFPNDISGKRIGVKTKTLFFKYVDFISQSLVKDGKSPVKIIEYDDVGMPAYDKIFMALKQGEIDMTLNDDEVLLKIKESDTGLSHFNLVGPNLFESFGKEQFGEGTGVAFRKDDVDLIAAFNNALDAVIKNCQSGGYKSVYEKYFKARSSLIAHCK